MTSGLCHRSGPEGVDFGIVSEAPSEGSCVAGWRVSHTGKRQGQVELLTKLRGKPKLPAVYGVWGGSSPVGIQHMLSKKLWSLGIRDPRTPERALPALLLALSPSMLASVGQHCPPG